MGRRKGSKNKKTRKTNSKTAIANNTFLTELLGGLTVVLGLALVVMFKFDNIGTFSTILNQVCTGLFGELRILIPVVCFYVGLRAIVSSKKTNVFYELIKGIGVTVLVAATVYAFVENRYDLWTNPAGFIKYAYNGSVLGNCYTGILGGIIANITYLMGDMVSKIVLVSFTLIFTLYYIDLGIRDFFAIIYNVIVSVVEFIANMFITVFSKDEEKIKKHELKIKEREKIKREKEIEKIHKIDEQRAAKLERKY